MSASGGSGTTAGGSKSNREESLSGGSGGSLREGDACVRNSIGVGEINKSLRQSVKLERSKYKRLEIN